MLLSLHIKNYALIEKLDVKFNSGFNAITGETGAGKSIIIGALNLLLGSRASVDVVRKGSDKSIVEGVFSVESNSKLSNLLNRLQIESLPELIIRREVSAKGISRAFINDTPVNLNNLKEAGDLLVDLHGQHDHQMLLNQETHIVMLDECGDYQEELLKFTNLKENFSFLVQELAKLTKMEKEAQEKIELYKFQIKEIDEVNPTLDEEEELQNKLVKLENSESLFLITNEIYNSLYDDENAVLNNLGLIRRKLMEFSRIDNSQSVLLQDFDNSLSALDEIAKEVLSYQNSIESNPEELEFIRERLGSISMLKKKYGGSLKALLDYRAKIGKEVEMASNSEELKQEIKNKIEDARLGLAKLAVSLNLKRKMLLPNLQKAIVDNLKYLGIDNAKFEINISNQLATESSINYVEINGEKFVLNDFGYDDIEFMISTNLGEDPKPLVKIASGGEISRIMLALKTVLANNEKLPLLVFDEIDVGISGRIAQKVGLAMKSLALKHQIIAITHLPQIAGIANHHYIVRKEQIGDRVVSKIEILSEDERIVETAKLLSGESVTESSLKSAKELINS